MLAEWLFSWLTNKRFTLSQHSVLWFTVSTTAAKRRAIKGVFPSAPKRKRTVMTLRDKVRVLDALRSGRSVASVSRHFSVNESTVRSIRQKEDDIRQRVRESAPETAKVTSVVRDKAMEKMEKRLSIWINEMIGIKGSVLDATSIRLKAKEIYEHVTENQEDVKPFSASAGWLFRFKNRYGFKNAKLSGEAGPADVEAAEEFVELLLKIIEEKGYQPEQVFNTDEACLLYKQTGSRTYLSKTVAKARGFKVFKDRATLLFCANARGDFKGKPLMVYRSQNPRVLKGKDLNDLPVIWKWNPKAWMTAEIFWDWFNNHFIPAVEQYLAQKNLVFKVLLILDNAPAHIHPDLENAHPNVEVLFMPPNVTTALQPMEQGIIKAFKSHYTQELYRNACQHLDANPDSTMVDFWKSVTICDVIDYVKVAWGRVSQATINNCWKAAWRQSVTDFIGFNGVDAQIKKNVEVIVSLARRIGGDGFDDMKEEDVAEILTQPAIEFTNEELDAMAKEGCKDSDEEEQEEDDVEVAPKIAPLTIAKLEKWASLMDEVSRDIQESDPLVERSLKFQRQLEHVFHPYAKLLKELRWRSRQTTLPQFFTPVRMELSLLQPSTSQEVASTEEEASDGDVELPSLELKEKNTVLESIVSEKLEKSLHWRGME